MKKGFVLLTLLSAFTAVMAQENDDMYFNAKDRVKLNASRSSQMTTSVTDSDANLSTSKISPTDSYSGRNVNPEYTSRSKYNGNVQEDPQYFISGYQPTGVNRNLSNCNCNGNNFYSPYYGNNYYNNAYGYSPYGNPFSNFYSPYNSFGNGFYPGMNSSLGYMWGGMGSGWFGNMNYGSMWGSPSSMFWNNYYGMNSYYGYNSMWGNSWYGSPWNNYYGGGYYGGGSYYYGNYYPRTVVVIQNADNSNVYYRKRMDRSSSHSGNYVTGTTTNSSGYTRNGRTVQPINGRTTTSDNSTSYYDRSWRRSQDVAGQNRGWSNGGNGTVNSGGSRSRSSSWSSGTNSSNNFWNGGDNRTRTNSWDNASPSRSSSWSNGGGSRSSSFSGGGSTGGGGGASRSSGGHSRGGRDN